MNGREEGEEEIILFNILILFYIEIQWENSFILLGNESGGILHTVNWNTRSHSEISFDVWLLQTGQLCLTFIKKCQFFF